LQLKVNSDVLWPLVLHLVITLTVTAFNDYICAFSYLSNSTFTRTYSKWSSHWTTLEERKGVPHMSNMLNSHWSIAIQLVLVGLYLLNRNSILSM